jgi:hypothetical protein
MMIARLHRTRGRCPLFAFAGPTRGLEQESPAEGPEAPRGGRGEASGDSATIRPESQVPPPASDSASLLKGRRSWSRWWQ